ncbi:peptidylprolyl isomerase [Halalkalibacter alkalisediminis]|uniref:Peptidyl-prolyl cis-trans isomerase n=1 Tax=Halalkalibacter alkalisediminis TaxID=935616 RepID=A0ABV6NJN9_9BACI|nr:peptidylprolyl isomerase [Halalkalibacter alkalisediminis]
MNKWLLLLVTGLLLVLTACGALQENEEAGEQETEETDETDERTEPTEPIIVEEYPIVTITMENGEEIQAELYPHTAPNTVVNFISLIEDGFYDGLTFHRVMPGFMIQGGDPVGDGSGGPGYSIGGEFTANGFENPLNHERGVLSMARTNDPNSGGSQFFIMVDDSPELDGQYASFGRVLEGMETVDAIVAAERDFRDKPKEEQKMKTVTVDTKGYEYPDPVVQ